MSLVFGMSLADGGSQKSVARYNVRERVSVLLCQYVQVVIRCPRGHETSAMCGPTGTTASV